MICSKPIIEENKLYAGKDTLEVMNEAKNYNNFLFRFIIKSLKSDNKVKNEILDFGAGNGMFATMVKNFDTSVCISCVEPDNDYCEYLIAQGFETYMDISEINIDKKYDLIYSFNVLEHIEEDIEILSCLKNKLSKTGKLILYVPAFEILYSKFDKKINHKRRYSKIDLCKKLNKAGFKKYKSYYVDVIGFFCGILYKIFNNSGKLNKSVLKIYDRYFFPFSCLLDKMGFRYLFGKNIIVIAQNE